MRVVNMTCLDPGLQYLSSGSFMWLVPGFYWDGGTSPHVTFILGDSMNRQRSFPLIRSVKHS
jgi:hypothetical protein